MVNLLANLTAAATAATLLGITDFQKQNAFRRYYCDDFAPIASFPRALTGNLNDWTLVGGPITFQIVTDCAGNRFLSYPSGIWPETPHAQVVTRPDSTTSWIISLVSPIIPTGPWNILESVSKKAITAWNQDPASSSGGGAPVRLNPAFVSGKSECWTDHPRGLEYHGHPPAILVHFFLKISGCSVSKFFNVCCPLS
ncbi:hypothetical protein C8J57DRAFT_66128 [Mycena rebaudengoi]|nr:hypothetical protein C8J57DRAFT_66128 [Mycena rebaudengoi]